MLMRRRLGRLQQPLKLQALVAPPLLSRVFIRWTGTMDPDRLSRAKCNAVGRGMMELLAARTHLSILNPPKTLSLSSFLALRLVLSSSSSIQALQRKIIILLLHSRLPNFQPPSLSYPYGSLLAANYHSIVIVAALTFIILTSWRNLGCLLHILPTLLSTPIESSRDDSSSSLMPFCHW